MSFVIGGIQKTSLIDFPNKIATIVFTQGCNFRCGYCHNPELLKNVECSKYANNDFFQFLNKRKKLIDGVVITGGEPCMQSGLYDFVTQLKDMNYLVKLDTNGTFPDVLSKLLDNNLLDYIAMDIKSPFNKYEVITKTKLEIDKVKESVNTIINSGVDCEFRTTVLKKMLSVDDLVQIVIDISQAKKYYLQKFVPSKILDKNLLLEKNYTDEEFDDILNVLNKIKPQNMNIYLR